MNRPAALVSTVVLAVVLCLLGLPFASAQRPGIALSESAAVTGLFDPAGSADAALIDALIDAGLIDSWLASDGRSAAVALLRVDGTDDYDVRRDEFIATLSQIAVRAERIDRLSAQLEQSARRIDQLETVVRSVRAQVAAGVRPAARSLTPEQLRDAQMALIKAGSTRGRSTFSRDRVALVDSHLRTLSHQLARELDALARVAHPQTAETKLMGAESLVGRFSDISGELVVLRSVLADVKVDAVPESISLAATITGAQAMMVELHELRAVAATPVAGLSMVTLDAYLRGADPECGITWPLLAGIGRIESNHGTIDERSVQASGRVTESILGPLLDGGATEAEELAAALQAAEDAAIAAAEAALLAEPTFDAELWGEETLERVQGIEEAIEAAQGDAVGLAFEPTPTPEPEDPPRFDPELWGEVELDGDGNDEPAGDEDPDDDEFVARGNGFAVIVDTDGGELDGNDRWDRAVGPMQFLPETWSYWETDGNGDGVTDPQNVYDAVATASRFLCDLKQRRGPSPYVFVLGYNASDTYVRNVMTMAEAYASVPLPAFEIDD